MIEAWREAIVASEGAYVAWGGLIIGIVFGFIVQRTNFCTMGSISDFMSFGDFYRFRSWLLAAAVAILGVYWLQSAGVADMNTSMYLTPQFGWLGNIVGGLMFGFGMVFAGGCASRNLVRAGSGDLRSLVVLIVMGVVAFMTIGGMIGPLRVALFTPGTVNLADSGFETQHMGEMLASMTGLESSTAGLVVMGVIVAAILIYCFKDMNFVKSPSHMIAGIGIGLCVIAGWMLTGLAADEFADNPVALISLTYVRPAGDTLDYMMRFTAFEGHAGFGVVTTIGALLGGFLGALVSRSFNLTSFADPGDTLRNLFGAVFMGIGGVLALGCTVGQALTGFSTLAAGSLLTFVAIVIGGMIGIKAFEKVLMMGA